MRGYMRMLASVSTVRRRWCDIGIRPTAVSVEVTPRSREVMRSICDDGARLGAVSWFYAIVGASALVVNLFDVGCLVRRLCNTCIRH